MYLFVSDGKLYVESEGKLNPCRVTVTGDGYRISEAEGDVTERRPDFGVLTVDEVIAQYGISEGGAYPPHIAQPKAATQRRK